jgi:hypothetical protein
MIGINRIKFKYHSNNNEEKEQNICREPFCTYFKGKEENKKIEEMEKELGSYAKFTGRLDYILDLMFPTANDIQKKIAKLIGQRNLSEEKQKSLPLFGYHLENLIKISKAGKEQWESAWANLMYNMGEFKLDEILIERNKENISCINIDDIIPHIYKFGNNWHVWWANIPEAEDIIRDIWDRIAGEEVQIISVDDDENFAKLFLGNNCDTERKSDVLQFIDLENKKNLNPKELDKSLFWIRPGTSYKDKEVIGQINHIVRKSQKDLLVFVIDLIFKKSRESNVIKGDELIRHLRNIKENALIVGITGGTSPFIINSAEKAGADIVVFKNRGGDPENIAGHSSSGNPIGVFDLLWAVSWNVSVWRLLEEYKRNYINNKNSEFENIAVKFFSNIENASPFWKKYLDKWKIDINKVKIKRLFS